MYGGLDPTESKYLYMKMVGQNKISHCSQGTIHTEYWQASTPSRRPPSPHARITMARAVEKLLAQLGPEIEDVEEGKAFRSTILK